MSDQTITPAAEPTPARKRTNGTVKRIEHSAAIAAYARAHPTDPTGKGFRAHMRRNFSRMTKMDPTAYGPKGTKRATNDRVPWPAHKASVLREVFASDAAFLNALSKPSKKK
jgi:hypothetical protein